jgi:hypothetical protein
MTSCSCWISGSSADRIATHAADFGVNPWRLQAWLWHSTINMTLRYVHHVEEHHRPIPDEILAARAGRVDPDERVVAVLGARSSLRRGNAWQRSHDPSAVSNRIAILTSRRDRD